MQRFLSFLIKKLIFAYVSLAALGLTAVNRLSPLVAQGSGYSSCGALGLLLTALSCRRALGAQASVDVIHGSVAWVAGGIFFQPGFEPVSPALAG